MTPSGSDDGLGPIIHPDTRAELAEKAPGVLLKVERAHTHAAEVELECSRLVGLYEQAFICELEGESGEYVCGLDSVPEAPRELPAIVGDAVHNLRTSLDHLAYVLVEKDRGRPLTEDEAKGTFFPIVRDTKQKSTPNLVGGVDHAIRAALDEVQPNKAGDPAEHELAVLHELDRIDKHRRLLVVVEGTVDNIEWKTDPSAVVPTSFHQGPFGGEHGNEIARFRIANPELAHGFNPDSLG